MKLRMFNVQNFLESEAQINGFLDDPSIQVRFVTQSESVSSNDWGISLCVWYDEAEDFARPRFQLWYQRRSLAGGQQGVRLFVKSLNSYPVEILALSAQPWGWLPWDAEQSFPLCLAPQEWREIPQDFGDLAGHAEAGSGQRLLEISLLTSATPEPVLCLASPLPGQAVH